MAKNIITQDGNLNIASQNPSSIDANVNISGSVNATKQINAGVGSNTDGTITSGTGANLSIFPATGKNLYISGNTYINNVKMPSGNTIPVPGTFIGSTSSGVVDVVPFIYAVGAADNMSTADLNTAYPGIMQGQYVVANTMVYLSTGTGSWQMLGNTSTFASTMIEFATSLINTQTSISLVQTQISTASANSIFVPDVPTLRTYNGPLSTANISGYIVTNPPSGITGQFVLDNTDAVTLDNGTTVIIDALGRRWKRASNGYYDIRWYGAVGDGSTDDTSAIQTALNSLQNGSSLYFPPGFNFKITNGVSLSGKAYVNIIGTGAKITIKTLPTLTDNFGPVSILFDGCANCTFKGFNISTSNLQCASIGLRNCTDCLVSENTIANSNITSNNCIQSSGCKRSTYTNNILTSGYNGIASGINSFLNTDSDVLISGNTIRNFKNNGVSVTSTGGRVHSNHISSNVIGISPVGGNGYSAQNVSIENNVMYGNGYAIKNQTTYSSSLDIPLNISIVGNICNNSTNSGISMSYVGGWLLSGNECINNGSFGIELLDNTNNISIIGNNCSDNRTSGATQIYGIFSQASSTTFSGLVISDNIALGNTNTGIYIRSISSTNTINALVVTGNICRLNGVNGLYLSESTAGTFTKTVVSGNALTNNTSTDIALSIKDVSIGVNTFGTQSGLQYYVMDVNSATPSMSGRQNWLVSNTTSTTITIFNNSANGQQFSLRSTNTNTIIANNSKIVNKGSTNVSLPLNGTISYIIQDGVAYETSRSF